MAKRTKNAMTSAQRQDRYKAKLSKFGVKKCSVKLSESERAAIHVAKDLVDCTNREAFIHASIHFYLNHLEVSMSDINEKLKAGEIQDYDRKK
ncbi:hypothetical protein K6U51_12205 [Vibrio fluvialis]|uniref:hypothetical protein n=1 Tax=Vibrio fluvialis TaxID=676 RepID=UPI001EEA9BA0|nr:hypothetical protein [Vibrio fluvialis]MCG6387575.1 hypothetical protein [Vibrio fluvialis]MCG6418798.1 hypothetical protein [Vibrio fluvialis]